jgi:sigma-E factor negative regulatory protein RseA
MSEQNLPQSFAESISALVDNQTSELELQRILKASEQDPNVKATWARYQLIGSVLRGEKVESGQQSLAMLPDFAASVSAAIASETQAVEALTQQPHSSWWHQLGRVALAASVAGGMIFTVQQFNSSAPIGAEIASNSNLTPGVVAPAISLPSGLNGQPINTRTVAVQAGYETRPQENRRVMFHPRQAAAAVTTATTTATATDEELTRYVNQLIQAHSDHAAMNSAQGVLPYTRVIITDEE